MITPDYGYNFIKWFLWFFYELINLGNVLWAFITTPIHLRMQTMYIDIGFYEGYLIDFDWGTISLISLIGGTGLVVLLIWVLVKSIVPVV